MTFKNKNLFHKINGQKGGRPIPDSKIRLSIPDITLVILTPGQYDLLLKRYGMNLLKKALRILDNWLLSGSPAAEKYVGKNNYAHFRSDGWVINEALREEKAFKPQI